MVPSSGRNHTKILCAPIQETNITETQRYVGHHLFSDEKLIKDRKTEEEGMQTVFLTTAGVHTLENTTPNVHHAKYHSYINLLVNFMRYYLYV